MTRSATISYQVGAHRPVYLWAGPGTVRMNKLKFMDALVDSRVHMEAHTPAGAERMAWEAGFNCAYLTYDWGFPPEIAQEDWREFEQALQIYQAAGLRVFGYIQTSNYVRSGSYTNKDWFARDPKGRPHPYYTGRLMTCWTDPEWLAHLHEMVQRVVQAGSDGIFFDNLWHGAQPFHLGGAWLGVAGCYCQRCQSIFKEHSGQKIPKKLYPDRDPQSQVYLRWRAEQVTQTLADLAWFARSLNPQVQVSANNFDPIVRPSFVTYGIDLAALAKVQDVLLLENFALPNWQPTREKGETPRLVNNALTLRTARALAGDTPLTPISYDKGIGFDEPYPPLRYRQGIAEAAACGTAMVVKGTEYFHQGRFTLLTAVKFSPQRKAIGQIQGWLRDNQALFLERVNAASIGLLHPGETLWQNWDYLAPIYFGVCQALTASGLPWQVLTSDTDLRGINVLLSFEDDPEIHAASWMEDRLEDLRGAQKKVNLRRVHVPSLPGWQFFRPGFLDRHRSLAGLVSALVRRLYTAYFSAPWARRLGDHYQLPQYFLQSPLYHVPPDYETKVLLEAIGERPRPSIRSDIPVLIEHWLKGSTHQLHLVNYASRPQQVKVYLPETVNGQILSPERPTESFNSEHMDLNLEVYSVLCYQEL